MTFTVFDRGSVAPSNHPQVALYTFTTPREGTVRIEFGLNTNYGLKTWSVPTPANGGPVSIQVAGMKPFRTYHLRVAVNWSEVLPFFLPIMGSIEVLPNGNMRWDAATNNRTPEALIREVTMETPPRVVWQLDIRDGFIYRSIRVLSLYPGVQW